MPHADALALPPSATSSTAAFYTHVCDALEALMHGESASVTSSLVSVAANASSVLFGSFENWHARFGTGAGHRVNWVGFYLLPSVLDPGAAADDDVLVLGPFQGRPACLSVSLSRSPTRTPGVCARAFLERQSQLIKNVDDTAGHIACDAATRSELVVPLTLNGHVVGVLDLDCERLEGFDEQDREGVEHFVTQIERILSG